MSTKTKKKAGKAKKTTKKNTATNSANRDRVTLFVDISRDSKEWLEKQCLAQVGRVSKSTMTERILHGLRTKPALFKQLAA